MATHRNIIKSDAEYTRSYEKMGGICSSVADCKPSEKYLYTENMYVDPMSGDGALESIPGFRILYSLGERINSIFTQTLLSGEKYILVHSGTKLYRFKEEKLLVAGLAPEPIATLRNEKSRAFTFGRLLYVIDGEKILLIDGDGNVTEATESDLTPYYIPTTYKEGRRLEQLNLLTPRFTEVTTVSSSTEFSFGSPELVYSITDSEKMTCAVTGVGQRDEGPLYIPARATIGGRSYTVTEIAPSALRDNLTITELITNKGLVKIGKYAFMGDKNLTKVILSSTVSEIGKFVFSGCESLQYLQLGIGVASLGTNVFYGCDALSEIRYTGSAVDYAVIEGIDAVGEREVLYAEEDRGVAVSIPLHTDAKGVYRVSLGGSNIPFTFKPATREVVLTFADRFEIDGRVVTVYGNASDIDMGKMLFGNASPSCNGQTAILGSTVCAVYDGRIFLSGNPSLGGAVFYSSLDSEGKPQPLYFGRESYFIDGQGSSKVTSLLVDDGDLVVFKSDDDGSGSIIYHTPSGLGTERSYPQSFSHSKTPVLGEAYRFLGGAVFISPVGISTLKRTSSDYRDLRCISGNISPLLLNEDMESASITRWQSYLAVLIGGKMYLGNAQDRLTGGSADLDWYYVSGVGTYLKARRVYRYSDEILEGFAVADNPGEVANGTVYTSLIYSPNITYYTLVGETKYLVHPTEELSGGEFSPATVALGDGIHLYFGTECGDICVFNNDKRGVAPPSVKGSTSFDEAEYSSYMGNRIHPNFYSFAGRAVKYAAVTAMDDCDVGYLEKRTVPSSLVLKLKNFDTGRLYCDMCTDKGKVTYGLSPASDLTFSSMGFEQMSAMTGGASAIRVDDRSQGWNEKQIALYTEEFCSPFGVYSIYYRYKIKGKLKKTTT